MSSFVCLRPAVSVKLTLYPSTSKAICIKSLVVPALEVTIELSLLVMRLNKEDFPTFGGPKTIIFKPLKIFQYYFFVYFRLLLKTQFLHQRELQCM